jgi:hypothetical protein
MSITVEIPAELEARWLALSEEERGRRLALALAAEPAGSEPVGAFARPGNPSREIPPLPTPEQARRTAERLARLFARWEAEDPPSDDPEEIARRRDEFEQLKAAINANRAASGEEPVY